MYDGTYDEYIRSILGYNQNELYDYGYNDNYSNYRMQDNITIAQNSQLEQSYPEIYKVVYPMVSKRCENVRADLSNEELEKMKMTKEKKTLIMRYGLYGREPMTQKEVAKELHISRSYVSRIEKKAIRMLKSKIKI